MGFSSISLNKGRAFLTMLGIIIGVASVMLILGIIEGVRRDVTGQIEGLGSNVIIVVPGKVSAGRFFSPGALSNVLTFQDVATIQGVSGVKSVSPLIIISNIAGADGRTDPGAINAGSSEQLPSILNLKIDKGRFLSKSDVDNKAEVAVVGTGPATMLFPKGDAVGRTVIVKEKSFRVVGVLQQAPSTSMIGGANFDAMVIIPYTTAGSALGATTIARIVAEAQTGADVTSEKNSMTAAVKKNHGGNEDFTVLTQQDILGAINRIIDQFASMIVSIAAISIIVGGIGIMNMMLVSVTERTREIGIRKAIGATSGNILLQFLSEAIALSFIGAVIGLGVAYGTSALLNRYSTTLHPYIDPTSVGLALVMAFFVGIIFGIVPAIGAARKNPIEALRYE